MRHDFKDSRDHWGNGWYAYIEDDTLFIGENCPREGGILYTGEYKGRETPYLKDIKEDDFDLYRNILEYFGDDPYSSTPCYVDERIVNGEQLAGHKIIVMTGRPKNVRAVAKYMEAILYTCPREDDYFEDYPTIIEDLRSERMISKALRNETDRTVIITTQNKEFLDCLLESDMDFVQVTVCKFEQDAQDVYRVRVMEKEEALMCRSEIDMELRA